MLITNGDIIKGLNCKQPQGELFTVFRQSTSLHEPLTLTLHEDDPAIILPRKGYEYYDGAILQADFRNLFKGTASEDTKKKILDAYQLDEATFRQNVRTVGCGNNIYLGLADGIFQACVQRSAPETMPDGAVMAGRYSRVAGGSQGDLTASQLRELVEEFTLFVQKEQENATHINLLPYNPQALQLASLARKLADEKRTEYLSDIFYNACGPKAVFKETRDITAFPFTVEDLTEKVRVKIGTKETIINAVTTDDPQNGDRAGVDTMWYLPLRIVHSKDIKIGDGETNTEGKLLNRPWSIKTPYELAAARNDGSMIFSPIVDKILKVPPGQIITAIKRKASRANVFFPRITPSPP